jgi:hypothetical protein
MREDDFNNLKELRWRRRLSPSESDAIRQFLAEQPQAAEEWAQEETLNRLFEASPSVTVSSNFTARVLASVRDASRAPVAREPVPWLFGSWWARLVAGAAMVCVGFFSFQEYQTAQRAREAHELAAASRLAALPPIEWLNDFDTIQRLDKVKVADDDLLSVLE